MKKKNNTFAIFAIMGTVFLALVLLLSVPKNDVKLAGIDFLKKYAATPNAMMIDVRTPAEFAAGYIDEAINIDFENQSFAEEVKKLDPTKTYFIYCRSGNRSGQAISLMKRIGIENVYELEGGVISNKETVTLVARKF